MPGPLLEKRPPSESLYGSQRISLYDEPRAPLQEKAEQIALELHPEHQALLNSTRPVPPRPVPVSVPAFTSDEQFEKVKREAIAISGAPLGPTTPYRPGFKSGEVLMDLANSIVNRTPEFLTDVRSNVTNSNDVRKSWREAVASIESSGSGDYGAIGPTHPKLGRAVGRYQIMESNVGPWTKVALGREMTVEEFLDDPQAQDDVFDHKFGEYVTKFGDAEKAAQAWFSGPGGVGTRRRDVFGTSVGAYGKRFMEALR